MRAMKDIELVLRLGPLASRGDETLVGRRPSTPSLRACRSSKRAGITTPPSREHVPAPGGDHHGLGAVYLEREHVLKTSVITILASLHTSTSRGEIWLPSADLGVHSVQQLARGELAPLFDRFLVRLMVDNIADDSLRRPSDLGPPRPLRLGR